MRSTDLGGRGEKKGRAREKKRKLDHPGRGRKREKKPSLSPQQRF